MSRMNIQSICLIAVMAFMPFQGVVAQNASFRHSKIGTEDSSADGSVKIKLIHKLQHFDASDKNTYDPDITSPKSVNIHPSGKKFYVNSLEGCATVVYEMDTWKKLAVIDHRFDSSHASLWAKPSGLFEFTHYTADKRDLNTFEGKPVEGAFSHGGRYFWVPYYRRSYDINAQDPSAMAVIDTRKDEIIRLFETGPLPKMVACSNDGKHIAVSHWGNNTVGTINIDSDDPEDWHYEKMYVVDYQLQLNFSLTTPVNRDANTGYALRGTVFTPDDHYLLVGCMGGGGGIAVIDMQKQEYMGRVLGMRANIRHIIIKDGWLYLGSNASGVVQRMRVDKFVDAASKLQGKTTTVGGWEECAVMTGARTIESSPSGNFVFAACNNASQLCVVDTRQMKMVANATVDSYPVGLDISKDGSVVIVTSQGRKNAGGGNAVNIYNISYAEPEPVPEPYVDEAEEESTEEGVGNADEDGEGEDKGESVDKEGDSPWWSFVQEEPLIVAGAAVLLLLAIIGIIVRRKKE